MLKRGTRHVVNRASTAYDKRRGPCHGAKAPGPKFRRRRSPSALPKPITARTHARLTYRMLKISHEYVDKRMEYYEAKYRLQHPQWVAKQAAALNMQLVAITRVVG